MGKAGKADRASTIPLWAAQNLICVGELHPSASLGEIGFCLDF
jgi:hypothetical protein